MCWLICSGVLSLTLCGADCGFWTSASLNSSAHCFWGSVTSDRFASTSHKSPHVFHVTPQVFYVSRSIYEWLYIRVQAHEDKCVTRVDTFLKSPLLPPPSWCSQSISSTSSSAWCSCVRPSGWLSASTSRCWLITSGGGCHMINLPFSSAQHRIWCNAPLFSHHAAGTWADLWWAVQDSTTQRPSWTPTFWPSVRKRAGANWRSTSSRSSTISTGKKKNFFCQFGLALTCPGYSFHSMGTSCLHTHPRTCASFCIFTPWSPPPFQTGS